MADQTLTPKELRQVMKFATLLLVGSYVFMFVTWALVHGDYIRLHPSNTTAETLKGFAARVEYALRYQTLLVFWLTLNVLIVIYGRITLLAINPLDENTESKVQSFKNVLTNSFESIVISVLSQLIFVSFAEPVTILKFIPYINIIQLIGRITFLAGYPLKRSFGYNCTLFPNLVLTAYNMYNLGSFIRMY